MSTMGRIVVLVLALGAAGCSGSRLSSPSAPTPAPSAPVPPVAPQPIGTQVNGGVVDSAFRPIAGAIVEILDGPLTGSSRITDADGRFSFSGAIDDTTRFRATSDGHVTATATLHPACDTCSKVYRSVYFVLAVLAPPVDIAGDFTLTFSADSACTSIPSEFRTRTYTATITPLSHPDYPPNTLFDVTISGAPIFAGYGSFTIGVAGDFVALEFGGDGGPSLVEEVAPTTYLGFDGHALASAGSVRVSSIAAPFQGFVDYCALPSPMGQYYDCRPGLAVGHSECESKNHRLILTRR
jgi:hypothetical protein